MLTVLDFMYLDVERFAVGDAMLWVVCLEIFDVFFLSIELVKA